MSPTNPENVPHPAPPPPIQVSSFASAEDPFKAGIEHACTGYKNAQEVIRFMDTKSGVIAGFVFVGIGCVLQAGKELATSGKGLELLAACPWATWVVLLIAMTSVGFGFWSVYCAIRCISPRPPSVEINRGDPTILFPFFDDADKKKADEAREYYGRMSKFDTRITKSDIAIEYTAQILNVGAILHKKISWNKKAASAFLVQLALLALVVFLTFLGFFWKTVPLG